MIVDVKEILAEIGPRFAGGKPIAIGGRELVGFTRKDGTVFARWVPRDEAPDTDSDYVEFSEPVPMSKADMPAVVSFESPALQRAMSKAAQ